MKISSPMTLFIHDLAEIYAAEQAIARMLAAQAAEVRNEQVRSLFLQHEEETGQQIARLEECFQLFKRKPGLARAFVVDGMEKDHESALAQKPSPDVLVQFDLGAAAKTEHYEIACYHGLAERARMMDNKEVHRLLSENMKQEQEMLFHIEKLSRMLGQESVL